MPDKINIYRLYDPIDIQLMKIDIEAAAAKVPTGDFLPGYMECTVFDNGFWTLENTMPPISGLSITSPDGLGEGSGVSSIDDARTAADKWMKDFDEALQGKQPANAYQNTASHQQMMAAIHPQYRDAYQAKPAKAAKQKPKFFENTIYIGGRSVSTEIDGQKQVYYRLVYGVQVKPSKDEDEVMVEEVNVIVEVWNIGVTKKIEYFNLPVKQIDTERTLVATDNNVAYTFDDELSSYLPYIEVFENTE